MARFHGDEAAAQAVQEGNKWLRTRRFSDAEMPEIEIDAPEGVTLPKLLKQIGFVPSNSEARRKIQEGAVHVDNQRIQDLGFVVNPGTWEIRLGKKKAARVKIG